MRRVLKFLAVAALAAGVMAAAPQAAFARKHGGGHSHGGHSHGGPHHRGGWGPGFVFGFGAPYYAPYYDGGDCGWVRRRVRYGGRWHVRRVWRCW